VEYDERIFLSDKKVVSERVCDLGKCFACCHIFVLHLDDVSGLTVLKSEEVYDLMSKDYPDKYQVILVSYEQLHFISSF
jgi:hypothetical protein